MSSSKSRALALALGPPPHQTPPPPHESFYAHSILLELTRLIGYNDQGALLIESWGPAAESIVQAATTELEAIDKACKELSASVAKRIEQG